MGVKALSEKTPSRSPHPLYKSSSRRSKTKWSFLPESHIPAVHITAQQCDVCGVAEQSVVIIHAFWHRRIVYAHVHTCGTNAYLRRAVVWVLTVLERLACYSPGPQVGTVERNGNLGVPLGAWPWMLWDLQPFLFLIFVSWQQGWMVCLCHILLSWCINSPDPKAVKPLDHGH